MDEMIAGAVLRWYESLEEQVVEFLRVVPPHGPNLDTWSPQLATILVEACNLIESMLYHVTPTAVSVRSKTKKRKELSLEDYAQLYCTNLRLSDCTAILLVAPPEYRTPFGLWSGLAHGSHFQSPDWWQRYNRSKHRRLDHFPEFTLTKALDGLAGALVTIACVPELLPAVIRHGWFDLRGNSPEGFAANFQNTMRLQPNEWFSLETSLFVIPIGSTSLPPDIKDFRPMFYGGSRKLIQWFQRL